MPPRTKSNIRPRTIKKSSTPTKTCTLEDGHHCTEVSNTLYLHLTSVEGSVTLNERVPIQTLKLHTTRVVLNQIVNVTDELHIGLFVDWIGNPQVVNNLGRTHFPIMMKAEEVDYTDHPQLEFNISQTINRQFNYRITKLGTGELYPSDKFVSLTCVFTFTNGII